MAMPMHGTSKMLRSTLIATFMLASGLFIIPLMSNDARADTVTLGTGAGSKVHMESDLNLLLDNGGGHIYWVITGPVAKEIRNAVDNNYGNSDGTVSSDEGNTYTGQIDNYLTAVQPKYHGAIITSFSLLTKNIEADTKGLMTSVNSTTEIEIDFLLRASSARDGDYALSDPIMVNALFEALQGGKGVTHKYVYNGKVELKHTSIFAGFASFSTPDISKGTLVRLRGPGVEYYQYTYSYDGGSPTKETISYSKFDPLRSSVELFIILLIIGYLMLFIPKRYARNYRKRKVKGFHWMNGGLVLMAVLVFVFSPDGLFVIIISPIVLIITWGLSHKIYAQGYRGWARPLPMRDRLEMDDEQGVLEMEDEVTRAVEGKWAPTEDGEEKDYVHPGEGPVRGRVMREQWRRKEADRIADGRATGARDDRMGSPRSAERVRAQQHAPSPREGAAPFQEEIYENEPEPPGSAGMSEYSEQDIIVDDRRAAQPKGKKVNVRCSKCRQVFTVIVKSRPTRIKCDKCGQEGMLD